MIEVLRKIWRFAGKEQGNIRKSMVLGFFYAVFHMFQIGAIYVVVLALVEAAGLIWQLLKAILPGDSRSHVFESLAIVGVCLVTIVATIFMLGLLVVTIMVACWVPARRAASVDPAKTLADQ